LIKAIVFENVIEEFTAEKLALLEVIIEASVKSIDDSFRLKLKKLKETIAKRLHDLDHDQSKLLIGSDPFLI